MRLDEALREASRKIPPADPQQLVMLGRVSLRRRRMAAGAAATVVGASVIVSAFQLASLGGLAVPAESSASSTSVGSVPPSLTLPPPPPQPSTAASSPPSGTSPTTPSASASRTPSASSNGDWGEVSQLVFRDTEAWVHLDQWRPGPANYTGIRQDEATRTITFYYRGAAPTGLVAYAKRNPRGVHLVIREDAAYSFQEMFAAGRRVLDDAHWRGKLIGLSTSLIPEGTGIVVHTTTTLTAAEVEQLHELAGIPVFIEYDLP